MSKIYEIKLNSCQDYWIFVYIFFNGTVGLLHSVILNLLYTFFIFFFCRILANTFQHYILCAFRKVLVSAPALLEVFRKEGVWDMIFSEKFFYFGPSLEEVCFGSGVPTEHDAINSKQPADSERFEEETKQIGVEILQVEAISFLEFAATLSTNTNNLVITNFFFIFLCLVVYTGSLAQCYIYLEKLHRTRGSRLL